MLALRLTGEFMAFLNVKINVMSPEEEQLIHDSSLQLLQKHGISVPNEFLLERAAEMGDEVDFDSETVKIKPERMEEIIKYASGGKERQDVRFRPMRMGVTPQPCMIDLRTKTRRYGTTEDILEGFAISMNLENMDLISPIVVPHDVPGKISDVVSYALLNKYLEKPGGAYIAAPESM